MTGTYDFDWDGSQESAKRYANRSRQRPFKLPEAPATNDRDKDWDPDPEPYDTRPESNLGVFG